MERQQLINGLNLAKAIMVRVTQINQEIANLQSVTPNGALKPRKEALGIVKCSLIALVIVFFVNALTLSYVTSGIIGLIMSESNDIELYDKICSIVNFIVVIGLTVPLGFYIRRLLRLRADKQNRKIDDENRLIEIEAGVRYDYAQARINEFKNELFALQRRYQNEVQPWYPQDYCCIEAADFFYNAVVNRRADTIGGAVNLYETELHRRRMEEMQGRMIQNQQNIAEQQKMNSMLQVGSIIMQGYIYNTLRRGQ